MADITREEAIEHLKNMKMPHDKFYEETNEINKALIDKGNEALDMAIESLENQFIWNPITTRPITEEEKKEYESLYGAECLEFMYVGALPDDAEEVLVATSYGSVALDTFYIDAEGCYFENYCDEDSVIAWARIPKPYKEKK